MFWIILGIILVMVFFYTIGHEFDGIVIWGGVFGGFMVGTFVLALISAILSLPCKEVLKEEYELHAIVDNSEITGNFFLGCGSIGEDKYYSYIIETERGKTVKTLKIEECNDIYFKDTVETPMLKYYEPEFEKDWWYWFAFPIEDNYWVFHIPEGSIIEDYEIDLK